MRKTFQMAAAGLAVVLASATAHGFVMEAKGPGAKWRTDIVKKNAKFTVCQLSAWQKCEAAAAKAGTGTGFVDCNILVDPAVSGGLPGSGTAPAGDIATLNAALDACDAGVNDPDPKKGLGAQNKAGLTLADIGCPGDCGTADGVQPCATPDAYELASIDPLINNRKTAVTVGAALGLFCADDTATTGTNEGATNSATLTTKAVKYIQFITSCNQKCQDDDINKFGNGFRNDTTNCIIDGPGDPAFNTCATDAGTKSGLTGATDCGAAATTVLTGVLKSALNSATNGNYDRVDLEAAFIGGVLGVAMPSQAPSMGGRGAAGVRASFGPSCATNNNSVHEDYEECDSALNSLCGSIPGTKAGSCGTATDPLAGTSPGRCPR